MIIFGLSSAGWAANYYVDFDNGNDANDGLSQQTAWKNIPGTMNQGSTARVSNNSGWVKVGSGDILKVKSGTIHDSSDGGRILIDSSYYTSGTSAAPITIQRDPNWGSGQIIIDGTGITVPNWQALLDIRGIDYLFLDGSVQNGIKIQNSAYNGFETTGNHNEVRNIEVFNSIWANVLFTSPNYPSVYLDGAVIENVVAHKTNSNDDWAANIYLNHVDNALVSHSTAYDANPGADGIHLGSCKNSWVVNCTTYSNGEQGIDLSRDGDYKMRDDSYQITVRDCLSYNNYKMNFDTNSAGHDIYFIRNVGWKTTISDCCDGNFMTYEAGDGTFYINDTSSSGRDWGYGFAWGAYYNLGPGSYKQYVINSVSSGDGGRSVNVETDDSSRSYDVQLYNSNLHSQDSSNNAANVKGQSYMRSDINNSTNGWPGIACKSADPRFVSSGPTWPQTDLRLQKDSPNIDAGAFPFTISSAGNGAVVQLNRLVPDLDARRIFRPGDTIQIESAGAYIVNSVDSTTQLTLTATASWGAGKGVWFPWQGAGPDIGAYEYQGTSDPVPSPPKNMRIR